MPPDQTCAHFTHDARVIFGAQTQARMCLLSSSRSVLSLCLAVFAARPFILLLGYAGFHAYRTVNPAKPSSDWNKSILAAMDGCSRLASCRVPLTARVNN